MLGLAVSIESVNNSLALSNLEESILKEYEQFLSRKKQNKTTVSNYLKGAQEFFNYLQDQNIKAINEETVDNYRNWLFSHKVNINGVYQERTYKATTINTRLATLRVFFSFLEKKGVTNYSKDLARVKVNANHHQRDNLTLEQVRMILNSIDTSTQEGVRTNAIFRLMVGTGLREIEVVNANIGSLKQRGNQTVLEIQGKGYNEIKDNVSDYVVIKPSVLNAINQYLKYRVGAKDNEPLFTSLSDRNNGKRLTTRSIRYIVKNLYNANGIVSERITTHSLRHTSITLALCNGATLQEAKEMARHSNINTTMIYAHDINRLESNAESKLEELFN